MQTNLPVKKSYVISTFSTLKPVLHLVDDMDGIFDVITCLLLIAETIVCR